MNMENFKRDTRTNALININEKELSRHKEQIKLFREIINIKNELAGLKLILSQKGLI